MKVKLDKSYDMPGPAAASWTVLQDVERVAGCMPGARIAERVDERHYKGTVAVKFGPANLTFRGEVEVLEIDAATQTLRLVGKGTDTTGGSGASMDITARVEAVDGQSSRLVGASEVSMSGKAAAFGSRMAGSVAEQVLKQFAANFAAQVQAVVAAEAAAASAASAAAAAPPAPAATTPATAAPDAAAAAPARTPAAPPPPAAESAPLNGLALAWAIVRDWLRSLFAARRS